MLCGWSLRWDDSSMGWDRSWEMYLKVCLNFRFANPGYYTSRATESYPDPSKSEISRWTGEGDQYHCLLLLALELRYPTENLYQCYTQNKSAQGQACRKLLGGYPLTHYRQ